MVTSVGFKDDFLNLELMTNVGHLLFIPEEERQTKSSEGTVLMHRMNTNSPKTYAAHSMDLLVRAASYIMVYDVSLRE